jgi:hypothetical protein
MKNKLKIMSERTQISDEELERFKDFDAVLNRYQAAGGSATIKLLKLILPVAVTIAVVLYFTVVDRQPEIKEANPKDFVQSTDSAKHQPEEKTEVIVADSGKESQPAVATPEKKSEQVTKTVEPAQPEAIREPVEKNQPVYVQAEPMDGYTNLYQYFSRELVYPAVAVKDSIQGVITVTFVISKTATIENIQFINSLGKPFEEEATRLLLNMPAWKAATLNGLPVASKISLPITFQIQSMKQKN